VRGAIMADKNVGLVLGVGKRAIGGDETRGGD
jgi:hypothetical protein